MQHFLIVYDNAKQEIQTVTTFPWDEGSEACTAYATAEETFFFHKNIDVYLLGSDTLETISRTHGNLFPPNDRLNRWFQGVQ